MYTMMTMKKTLQFELKRKILKSKNPQAKLNTNTEKQNTTDSSNTKPRLMQEANKFKVKKWLKRRLYHPSGNNTVKKKR